MKNSSVIPRLGFVSLGCPKALVDSERIITQLRAEGYEISGAYDDAHLVVVNTCGFIEAAIEESLEAIAEAIAENGRVIVTGCLGVKEEMIRAKFPQVLAITGPQAYEEVRSLIHESLPPPDSTHGQLVPPQGIKLTPRHYAYVKISEGCNHQCRFCIIPSMRGPLLSRPIDEVLQECQALVNAGVRELLIISQDSGAYGVDRKYAQEIWQGRGVRTKLLDLAHALSELGVWIRLHYVYPYPHVDDLIPLMAEGKILPYLDMPLQHGSEKILRAMRRPGNIENMLQRIQSWRRICNQMTIRSSFIVGFPGETEEDFNQLLSFVEEAQLNRVGCFVYSPVEGAAANELPGAVEEEIKQERMHRFMERQSKISESLLKAKLGSEQQVLVDEILEQGIMARSVSDAPEIDGLVWLQPKEGVQVGDFLQVEITDSDEHDLYGKIIE